MYIIFVWERCRVDYVVGYLYFLIKRIKKRVYDKKKINKCLFIYLFKGMNLVLFKIFFK